MGQDIGFAAIAVRGMLPLSGTARKSIAIVNPI
jgi:hypothetical protein